MYLVYQYPIMPASAKARQNEFSDVLLRNIFQPNVAEVHVLLEKENHIEEFYDYVERDSFLPLGKNSKEGDTNWDSEKQTKYFEQELPKTLEEKKQVIKQKLKVYNLGKWMLYKDGFQYASQHLPGTAHTL